MPQTPRTLYLTYKSQADLAAHLGQNEAQQAMMIPLPPTGEAPQQFERLALCLALGGAEPGDAERVEVEAEVLQLLGATGLVVRLPDPAPAAPLIHGADPSPDLEPPEVSWTGPANPLDQDPDGAWAVAEDEPEQGPTVVKGHQLPPGMSPRNWPIEKLRAEWDTLTVPQKIQVAKHGKKGARRMIARQNDKKLHHFILLNPHITVDEVAVLVGNPSLEPEQVRRIANSPEWTRHASIARNLVCHPRLPLPIVTRLVEKLRAQELRRLVRSGRLRASVKRIVVKKLDRSRI